MTPQEEERFFEQAMQEAGAMSLKFAKLRDTLKIQMREAYLAHDPRAEEIDAAYENAKLKHQQWEDLSLSLERQYYQIRRKNLRDNPT